MRGERPMTGKLTFGAPGSLVGNPVSDRLEAHQCLPIQFTSSANEPRSSLLL